MDIKESQVARQFDWKKFSRACIISLQGISGKTISKLGFDEYVGNYVRERVGEEVGCASILYHVIFHYLERDVITVKGNEVEIKVLGEGRLEEIAEDFVHQQMP